MSSYRHDIDEARLRLAASGSRSIPDSRFGVIEYAEWGKAHR